jgi:hypothetical protein
MADRISGIVTFIVFSGYILLVFRTELPTRTDRQVDPRCPDRPPAQCKKGGIVDLGKNSGFLQATDFVRHILFTLATFSA